MDFSEGSIDHQVMAVLFNSLDADEDGKLSMNELMTLFSNMSAQEKSAIEPFFDACDKDGDKRINLEEFKEFYTVMDDSSGSEAEEDMGITAGCEMSEETLEELFKSLDADSDGKLVISDLRALFEVEEDSPSMKLFFEACDTNKDQRITLDEFKAFYKNQREHQCNGQKDGEKTYGGMTEETIEKLFKSLDTDSDGKLVMNDLKALVDTEASDADMKPFFDACDTDGDKRITLEEFKAFYKGMGEDQETTKASEKPEGDTPGGMTEETMEKLFKSLDADSDGKLVMNELKALVDAEASDADMKLFFEACDADGDQRITLEEFKAFYKSLITIPSTMDLNGEFEERMKSAFRAIDTDESGFLEVPELEAALKSVGDFTKTQVEAMVKKILEDDENGDGKLSLEEFLKGVMKGKAKLKK